MLATDPPRLTGARQARLAAAMSALLSLHQAQALDQAPGSPSISDADLARAAQRYRMPSDEELARVPVPAPVNIDALPKPALVPGQSQGAARGINFGEVARGYDAAQAAALQGGWDVAMPSLIVFISFAMPMPTLERLVSQAQAAGATLVLRGLVDGSLRETVQRCQALIGQRQVAIQIDPQAFDRFAVTQTPTFVLVKAGHQAERQIDHRPDPTQASADFVSVRGDVSLDYALRAIAARDPSFKGEADRLLRRLPEDRP